MTPLFGLSDLKLGIRRPVPISAPLGGSGPDRAGHSACTENGPDRSVQGGKQSGQGLEAETCSQSVAMGEFRRPRHGHDPLAGPSPQSVLIPSDSWSRGCRDTRRSGLLSAANRRGREEAKALLEELAS
jgi:hypothetical protein